MERLVREFQARPEHKFYDVERDLADLGNKLGDMKRARDGIEILKLSVEFNPTSAASYRTLAEAYEQNGDSTKAAENYEKALQFEKVENIRFWLTQKVRIQRALPVNG